MTKPPLTNLAGVYVLQEAIGNFDLVCKDCPQKEMPCCFFLSFNGLYLVTYC